MSNIDQIQGEIRLKDGQRRAFLLALPGDPTQEQWTSALQGVCQAAESLVEDDGDPRA